MFIGWLDLLGSTANNLLGLALLFGSAFVEYVFPPFPGDVLTVFGGVLVSAYDWSFALVFASVTMGSVLGGLMAFVLGQRWHKRREAKKPGRHGRLEKLVDGFGKHGSLYLLLNRFLPGIRPLLFLAAGLSGMSMGRVFVLSTISAAVYNVLLLALGMSVGHNLARIQEWLTTYSLVVWALLFVIALVLLAKKVLGRKGQVEETSQNEGDEGEG